LLLENPMLQMGLILTFMLSWNSSRPTNSVVPVQDMNITSLHWVEGDGTNQYRVLLWAHRPGPTKAWHLQVNIRQFQDGGIPSTSHKPEYNTSFPCAFSPAFRSNRSTISQQAKPASWSNYDGAGPSPEQHGPKDPPQQEEHCGAMCRTMLTL